MDWKIDDFDHFSNAMFVILKDLIRYQRHNSSKYGTTYDSRLNSKWL